MTNIVNINTNVAVSTTIHLSKLFDRKHDLYDDSFVCGIEQSIMDYCDSHFHDCLVDPDDYLVDQIKTELEARGYEVGDLTEDQEDQLLLDIGRSASSAQRDAEFVAYAQSIYNNIERILAGSGLRYRYIKPISVYDGLTNQIRVVGEEFTDNLYEAGSVMVCLTHASCKKMNGGRYTLEETLESIVDDIGSSDIGYDYRSDAYYENDHASEIFFGYNEVTAILTKRDPTEKAA